MSVWKKIESKVLEAGVDRNILELALGDMGISLDNGVKEIKNGFGKDSVDAALVYRGKVTSMGLRYNKQGGVQLVGDIWGTGLGTDGKQEGLMDKIAHNYQKRNIVTSLENNGWTIENTQTVNGKTVIEVYQF
jgi:hypothetical protein